MTDCTHCPGATEDESRTLDMIDSLTAMVGPAEVADFEVTQDAMTEALFAERRLAASREVTWLRWAQAQRDGDGRSMFDIYAETDRKRGDR